MNARINITRTFTLLLAAAALLLPPAGVVAKEKQGDVWLARETLANRFGTEWYKIGMLNRELGGIADVLADLRDLELFPAELTGLDKANLVRFDRKIERMEKKHLLLAGRIEALKPRLADGLAILRQMVVHEPVESMFEVLEQGDLARITEMLEIKHQIDTLWRSADSLMTGIMESIGIAPPQQKSTGGFSEEFFTILRASIGQQSEGYCRKLGVIKDTLSGRASPANKRKMYAVEMHHIKDHVKANKLQLAERKISEVASRYRENTVQDDLPLLSARIALVQGEYEKALLILPQASPAEKTYGTKTLYRLQSLYALHRYDTLWQEGAGLDFGRWSGAQRNLLIWITMETGLALGKRDVFVRLASLADRSAPYILHVMHALGRSYLAEGDQSTALSVFESAVKLPVRSELDRLAGRELRTAIAETNYQLGRYDKALALFYDMLNDQSEFERALYGIMWCYLSLGQNDKAETTLRKLINQAPESSCAVDGFLIFAQRYLYKAQYEWKKILYLTKEEERLTGMLERIGRKLAIDSALKSDKKFMDARRELTTLLGRLRAEPHDSYETIAEYYANVGRVCDLINSFYSTGSFQKAVFTEKREDLLHYLDSVMQAASSSSVTAAAALVSNRRQEISAIKTLVNRAAMFNVEALIERCRFEMEYISWQKAQVNYHEQKAVAALLPGKDSTARAAIEAQKKKSAHVLDSLLAAEERIKQTWSSRLTGRLQSLLAGPIDSADAAYFHYHLGELRYAEENGRFTHEYDAFEKARALYEQRMAEYREAKQGGQPPVPPAAPRITHDGSMKEFTAALRLAPASDIAAAIHYSLAWCWNDRSVFDSAFAHMEIVAAKFPKSQFAPQAWMYAGEYLFDRGNLSRAILCYQAVIKYPESEWFDEALYKLAWSQYRLSNPEKAISSFLALVGLGEGRTGKSLLEKESLDYIAISFSEADVTGEKGLERATAFVRKLDDPDRASQILHRLVRVYRDQGRYDMSKKTYRTLLKMNPAYSNMPDVESEFLPTMERDVPPEEAARLKIDFYKKYNRTSDWAKAQTDERAVKKADSLAEARLYDAAIGAHQLALQKNDTATYGRALAVYADFIRAYPKSPHASECHYNLAEIEFSLGDYLKAAQDYIAVSLRYPESKFRETAAWNAIVASQNLLKKEGAIR